MPTTAGYETELMAMKLVANHLGVQVEHTGTDSKKPDLLVSFAAEQYEIDVTVAVEEWRMEQQGSLFRNGGFELCELPDLPISLVVSMGRHTNIKKLDNSAAHIAKLVLESGVERVFATEYYMAKSGCQIWGITEEHQNLLRLCSELGLESMQLTSGSGKLIRLTTSFGGIWGGGVEEFDKWLHIYLNSDSTKDKVSRSLRLSTGALGLFVWLTSSVDYGAHEWIDRGQGVPSAIELSELGIKELWVASPHGANSFVHLSTNGWHASHNAQKSDPWFARHGGSFTQL